MPRSNHNFSLSNNNKKQKSSLITTHSNFRTLNLFLQLNLEFYLFIYLSTYPLLSTYPTQSLSPPTTPKPPNPKAGRKTQKFIFCVATQIKYVAHTGEQESCKKNSKMFEEHAHFCIFL